MRNRVLVALALVLATLAPEAIAQACALAFEASARPPRVEGEEALIVWDEAHHVEHFVRSARFAGVSSSFAFLVPTPGRPELAEADDGVFARLARLYLRPAPVARGDVHLRSRGLAASAVEPPVTVVEETRVAGLDATVLAASDPHALAEWLRARRYATRPDLDAWLAPYVSRGFHLTAFRYDPSRQSAVTSRAVRLSFPADAAFYPYAEPTDAPAIDGRTLRLSVVAPFRVEAHEGGRAWGARVGYAARPRGLDRLLAGVVPDPAAVGPWVTTFDDSPSRRGRDDLEFVRARAQRAVAASIDTVVLGTRPRP